MKTSEGVGWATKLSTLFTSLFCKVSDAGQQSREDKRTRKLKE